MTEAEQRYTKLAELIAGLLAEAGDTSGVLQAETDPLAQVEAGVGLLAEELRTHRATARETSQRLVAISDMLAALVGFNFAHRLHVGDKGDAYDAFAYSLNVLAEELGNTAVSREYVDNIFQSMSEPILVVEPTGLITTVNRALYMLCGYRVGDLIGQDIATVLSRDTLVNVIAQGQLVLEESTCSTSRGVAIPVSISAAVMKNKMEELQGIVFLVRDLRESRRIEAERWQLREAMQRQAILLEELSTPLIPITNEIVVVPLIGTIDQERAKQMAETLLHGIAARRARVAIIDVTGVPTMDQSAVAGIVNTIRGLGLLGTQVVLTGIKPEVASNLVRLGSDLDGIATAASLQSGINHALRHLQTKNAPTRTRS